MVKIAKTYCFLTLLLMSFVSYGNIKHENKKDFVLAVEFWPSFNHGSILSLEKKSENYFLSLSEIRYKGNYNTLPKKELLHLYSKRATKSLMYRLKQYIKEDTVFIRTLDKKEINPSEIKKRFNAFNLRRMKTPIPPNTNEISTDGISVHFDFKSKDRRNVFSYKSMGDNKKIVKLIGELLEMMTQNFEDTNTLQYVERLYLSFRLGENWRKVKNEPLSYSVYGISYGEEKIVPKKFFKKLPENQMIVFDLRNLYGDYFFSHLEKFSKSKCWNIFILRRNSIYEKQDFNGDDINKLENIHVFKSKDSLTKAIKEPSKYFNPCK